MKDSLFIKICLIIIIFLLGLNFFFSHSNSDRYSMYVDTKSEGVFKIDKQTGRIWVIPLLASENFPIGSALYELGTKPVKIKK